MEPLLPPARIWQWDFSVCLWKIDVLLMHRGAEVGVKERLHCGKKMWAQRVMMPWKERLSVHCTLFVCWVLMWPSVWTEWLAPQPTETLKKERQLLQSGSCTNNGKVWRLCALRLYTLATAVPVGATFLNPPHLNAFEGPLGAYCHVDFAVPVGVEALSGSRAFRSHSPTGMKNPFFGCTWKREKHWTLNRAHSCRGTHSVFSHTRTSTNLKMIERLQFSEHHRVITVLFVSHSFHFNIPHCSTFKQYIQNTQYTYNNNDNNNNTFYL